MPTLSTRSKLFAVGLALLCLILVGIYGRKAGWSVPTIFRQTQIAQAPPPGAPLRLDPVNPHYFLFRGQTIPLVTASPGYGTLTNLDVDYVSILNNLSSASLNKIRIFTGDFIIVDSGSSDSLHVKPNRFVKAWARSSTPGYAGSSRQLKFDLNVWDNIFFNRLDSLVRSASQKGIIVEVGLFSQYYDDHIWSYSPLKGTNNVNGVTNLPWRDCFTLSDPDLVARQDAYVRKIVDGLNQYDNVYYEVANEAWGYAWHDHIIQTIIDTEASLPNKHLIAVDGAELYSALRTKPSIVNTHYANDLGGEGKIHWIAAFPLLDNYYTLNIPLAFDESSVTPQHQSAEQARVEAWEFLVGGGSVYDNLNWKHPDKTLYRYLKVLKAFLLNLNLPAMAQDKSVIVSGLSPGAIWRGLSDRSSQYAIYIHHSTPGPGHYNVVNSTFQENLQLDLPSGDYSATWIDPRDGRTISSSRLASSGTVTLQSPRFVTDIALTIVKTQSPSASR